MIESATALWLDSTFAGFDHAILSFHHFMADKAGFVLTPLMRAITFLGEKGWPFFLLALLFMLTAKQRPLGVCIFGAVCCGALITNIILKDNVARIRPFLSSIEYELWWKSIGSPPEEGFSFPSGHLTACAAGMTAITLMRGKKWILPSVLTVVLMGCSRNYLMAHYPTDVIAGALIGLFSGIVAWFITQIIFRTLRRYRKSRFCDFVLHFDIRDILPFDLPGSKKRRERQERELSRASEPRRESETRREPERSSSRAKASGDEDVKTYSSRRGSTPAAKLDQAPQWELTPRTERTQSAAPETQSSRAAHETQSSRAAAPARSGGRHALPEGSSSRGKSSGSGYQGKH